MYFRYFVIISPLKQAFVRCLVKTRPVVLEISTQVSWNQLQIFQIAFIKKKLLKIIIL